LNGRVYRDGEVFQPSCKLQCRCLDGGFTCVPLCQEDVRLPTPDCPYPRRVEVPGKCCPEWICEARDRHLLRDAGAGKMHDMPARGCPHRSLEVVPSPQITNTSRRHLTAELPAMQGSARSTRGARCAAPGSNDPFSPHLFSSSPWGSIPTAAVPLPGVGHGVDRLLGYLRRGLFHPRLQPEPLLPAGDSAAALHGQTLPGSAGGIPGGKWASLGKTFG